MTDRETVRPSVASASAAVDCVAHEYHGLDSRFDAARVVGERR